jgi:hypothetical protein
MPLCGISFPLSASSELLTEASKPLLIKACFYLTEIFPVINSTKFQVFKMRCLCVLRINIISIFMPRISTMGYRGFFVVLKAIGMGLIAQNT